MHGAVARSATLALAEATLPYLRCLLADPRAALDADPGFAAGLNLAAGQLTHAGLAQDMVEAIADWQPLIHLADGERVNSLRNMRSWAINEVNILVCLNQG